MANVLNALSLSDRRTLRETIAKTPNPFIHSLPKVELHIHIEGTLTPSLKWFFAQRNNLTLRHPRTGHPFTSLEQLQASHDTLKPITEGQMSNAEETLSFFEAYYSGFEVLKTRQDYYDLAMHYFERAAGMNVRYCEIFFDPQGHTRTGVTWETMMTGFREASLEAENNLNVKSAWILCLLRDESPESAMQHYLAALPYRDLIVGIGLDSNEEGRPPSLFEETYLRARADGFRLTSHCDVGPAYPLSHIHQVLRSIGGSGAERIDHGLNATDSTDLVAEIVERGVGMTVCPWSYIRHQPFDEVFARIRVLFDAGAKMAIGSDDPAFMEDTWIYENFVLLRECGGFSEGDMLKLARDAVEVCWAEEEVKRGILEEIEGLERAVEGG